MREKTEIRKTPFDSPNDGLPRISKHPEHFAGQQYQVRSGETDRVQQRIDEKIEASVMLGLDSQSAEAVSKANRSSFPVGSIAAEAGSLPWKARCVPGTD